MKIDYRDNLVDFAYVDFAYVDFAYVDFAYVDFAYEDPWEKASKKK